MSVVKSGGRPRRGAWLAAEFRLQEIRLAFDALARDHARLLGAAGDVLHALPGDRGAARRRLRLEMAGRGTRRAA